MTTIVDEAIAAAKSLPDLIGRLEQADPQLAQQLQGKSLAASRTPWGTLAAALVAWLSSRYGLGWDDQVSALVGGLGLLAGAYLMRALSSAPIRGLLRLAPSRAVEGPDVRNVTGGSAPTALALVGAMVALALQACGVNVPVGNLEPGAPAPTTSASVAEMQAALTAAGRAILACYAAPDCAASVPRASIRAAFDRAYQAVTDAQAQVAAGGSPSLAVAEAALSELQSLLPANAPAPPPKGN